MTVFQVNSANGRVDRSDRSDASDLVFLLQSFHTEAEVLARNHSAIRQNSGIADTFVVDGQGRL
jgi:hypothetical protein